MPQDLLWVHKTGSSVSLSHSEDSERLELLSHAQRISRARHARKKPRGSRDVSKRKDKHSHCHDHPQNDEHTIKPVPCVDPDWTPEEQRGVAFFLEATVFKVISVDRDGTFWREMLPRLTRLHSAFRHLVVAISSTHELLFGKDTDRLNVFSMKQCNKATHLLRSSKDLDLDLLLASCILVSAYSLLRCDLTSADKSIESGLKMASQPGGALRDDLKRILSMLGRQNGFKLWAPDITYQFEKSTIASESFIFPESSVNGPFVDSAQVLTSYRTITVEVVAKVMRNLARGAYVDPHCSLALEIAQQLGMFAFYLEDYSSRIPPECTAVQMELAQIEVGFLITYLIFHTKVISPNELTFETHIDICHKILELADEILKARHANQPLKYIDRIVNGSLFSLGLSCREPLLRHRVTTMLQSQKKYENGLVNYVRGMVIYMLNKVEERLLGVRGCEDKPHRRPTLAGLRCREDDRMVCLEYSIPSHGASLQEEWLEWDGSFDTNVSAREINNCLQGIMTAYRMYGKPTMIQAPRGYVHEMHFRGRPVPVYWGEGCSL